MNLTLSEKLIGLKPIIKKLPENQISLEKIFLGLQISYSNTKINSSSKEIKQYVKDVQKLLDVAKLTMDKWGFVLSLQCSFKNWDEFETFKNTDNLAAHEIDYVELFKVAFHYAGLLYYRRNYNKNIEPTSAILACYGDKILSNLHDEEEPSFIVHRETIMDNLSNNWSRKNDYLLYIAMGHIDSQFAIDSYDIYQALSSNDAVAFAKILDRN